MAKYDRQCASCGEVFEVTCKIAEKSDDHPCTNCGMIEGKWLVSAPSLVQHQRLSIAKKDTGFKEVLQKIASRNQRNQTGITHGKKKNRRKHRRNR